MLNCLSNGPSKPPRVGLRATGALAGLAMAGIWLVALCVGCGKVGATPELRDGDLIFQTSRSAQSLAIQRATGSPYSHMGVVVFRRDKPYVLEAVATVRYTPLSAWIKRGVDGRYVVKRLRDAEQQLTGAALQKAGRVIKKLEGKPYDLVFDWSDERMYCSELVWKIYDRAIAVKIGGLQKLGDFDLEDPAVQLKLRERYGKRPPLEAPVISPAAMFASPLLETVVER